MSKPKTLRDEIARIVGERPGIVRNVLQPLLLNNTELADEFDLDPKKIATALKNMTYAKHLDRDADGHYTLPASGQKKVRVKIVKTPDYPTEKDWERVFAAGNKQITFEQEQQAIIQDLASATGSARSACEKYIDSLNDPILDQLIALLDSAKAAELNYLNMSEQGAP